MLVAASGGSPLGGDAVPIVLRGAGHRRAAGSFLLPSPAYIPTRMAGKRFRAGPGLAFSSGSPFSGSPSTTSIIRTSSPVSVEVLHQHLQTLAL